MDKRELMAVRDYNVTKSNALIQRSRHSLSMVEQKIVLYLISKLQPEDDEFKWYDFKIKEFCEVCGIEAKRYDYLKDVMSKLAGRCFWATIDDRGTEAILRWVNSVHMNEGDGTIKIKLHEDMMPFLLDLKERFTSYRLYYILAMKSQYAIRIYELLKSYQGLKTWTFNLEDLKRLLMCESKSYDKYDNFKRKVLDIAVREINLYSDLKVGYTPLMEWRKVDRIRFDFVFKDVSERVRGMADVEKVLDKD